MTTMNASTEQRSQRNRDSKKLVMEDEERERYLFVSIKTVGSDMLRQMRKFREQNDIFMERRFMIAT